MADITHEQLVEKVVLAIKMTTGLSGDDAAVPARAAIAAIAEATMVPTEAQWSGLARRIIMAWDMNARTAGEIISALERLGEVPQWLRDEAEMQMLGHVPSKGTRAAIIYRAMQATSPLVNAP